MAELLSGTEVSRSLDERTAKKAEMLRRRGVVPKLVIVRCGESPSDLSYERGAMKRAEALGVRTHRIVLGDQATKEELLQVIRELNADTGVHGVLLFRPLPKHLAAFESVICNALDPEKDVDSMTDISHAGVYENREIGFPPCTPEAVIKILDHYGIEPAGSRVAVIGRSLVVGKPVAMMLMARHATVTVCHTRTADVPGITREADIVVSSAGVLRSLTREHVREGQVIIDVSINWDPSKKDGRGGIAGDADFEEVEKVVKAITPVPGGVGAVTTSVLIEHVVRAAAKTVRE